MSDDDLQKRLDELQARLEEAKSVLKPLDDKTVEINAQMYALQETYNKQMNEFRDSLRAINNEALTAKQYVYDLEAEARNAKQKWEQEERERILKEQYAKEQEELAAAHAILTERFDRLTAGAFWREWAKDHQIQGGHFITENRRVILADVMGLGKTLTSVITVEMAQQYTKQATPELPLLGFEKEEYVPKGYAWTQKAVEEYQADPEGRLKRWGPIELDRRYPYYMPYDTKNQFVNEGIMYEAPEKTIMSIHDGIEHPVGLKVLYLCPAPLVKNVRDEWRHWAKHRNVVFISNMTKAEREFLLDNVVSQHDEFVVVCNYEAWRKDLALIDRFVALGFDTVIIDEAHNAKNNKTSVWRGINSILTRLKPEYIIPMTGTPILNKPEELFWLLNMVNPEEYFRVEDFLYAHCQQIESANGRLIWVFKPGGLERLAKKIRKNFLRRTKEDAGIILPPRTIIVHELEIDEETFAEQCKAREQMRKYMTVLLGDDDSKAISATVVIAMYTRLRQIETWPAGIVIYESYTDTKGNRQFVKDPHTGEKKILMQLDVEESQKIDYIIRYDEESGQWEGLIPEGIEDERMVLFSQFKAPLAEIERRVALMGKRPVRIDGSTPKAVIDQARIDFDRRHTPNRADAKWDIALCNYKVGGVGLNLTAATQMVILDEEWNPGKRDQAYDRIHRIGQDNPTTIHVVRMKNTVDDWLAGINEEKEDIVNGFQNAVGSSAAIKDALKSGLI